MRRFLPLIALFLLVLPCRTAADTVAAEPQSGRRDITVDARKFRFEPSRIEVFEGDIVQITLVAADIPHSFTIDAYKIAKRAEPGKPVTFEFLADQVGTFKVYCNLATDTGCKKMMAELIVRKRPERPSRAE